MVLPVLGRAPWIRFAKDFVGFGSDSLCGSASFWPWRGGCDSGFLLYVCFRENGEDWKCEALWGSRVCMAEERDSVH